MLKGIIVTGFSITLVTASLWVALKPKVISLTTPMLPALITIKENQTDLMHVDSEIDTLRKDGRYIPLLSGQKQRLVRAMADLDGWLSACAGQTFDRLDQSQKWVIEIENSERILTYSFSQLPGSNEIYLTTVNQVKDNLLVKPGSARYYTCPAQVDIRERLSYLLI